LSSEVPNLLDPISVPAPLTDADVEALEQESELIIRTLSGVVESTYPLDVHYARLALVAYAREAAENARREALEEAAQLVVGEVIRIELTEEFMPALVKGDTSKWQKHILEQVASHIRARAEEGQRGRIG